MYNSVCVARTIDDFSYEKRIRKKLRRQLQQDGDNEWTSRAMEFEKTWEDKKPRKAHALVKQYSSKSKSLEGKDEISAGKLKYLPPSGIREMTEIIRSIWIDERIPDSWRRAIVIPHHKKLSVTDPRNYRGISLLRVMYKVLESYQLLDTLLPEPVFSTLFAPMECQENSFACLMTRINEQLLQLHQPDVDIKHQGSTKLQRVANLVRSWLQPIRPEQCKPVCISLRPRTEIRVDRRSFEFVDELCYLGCTLKNNGSYERDVQQRCAKATFAFNSLTKCLRSTPITNEVKLRVYLSAIRPVMLYGSETWAAPSTVMERLDCTERKLLRRLLCYRRMTRGKYQYLAPPPSCSG
ncbi:hypothetical protein RB195_005074 [Necator americanus]|uniref:Reverse transcriptase domain-containing protein n=1 Tax=Necator americanus TaxID=51031 RepID=A0ABR1BPZ2_NECAM